MAAEGRVGQQPGVVQSLGAGRDRELGEPVQPPGLHPAQPGRLRVEAQHGRSTPARGGRPSPSQNAAAPIPHAATTPTPVMTTRRPSRDSIILYLRFCPTRRGGGYRRSVETDVLGPPFEQRRITLADDFEGEVVATLVRRPAPAPAGRAVLYLHGYVDYFFQTHLAEFFTDRGTTSTRLTCASTAGAAGTPDSELLRGHP